MFRKLIVLLFTSCFAWLFVGISLAADPPRVQQHERAFGWNLMTPEERTEHQSKMRSFETKEEREQYRIDHHKKMKERMKERGITLPDQPRNRGGMGLGERKMDGEGSRMR